MNYPGGSYETWTYDGNSNMTQYRTRSGVTMTCTIDNRNRDTFCDWSDITPDVSKTYDAAGRVLTISNSVASSTFTYDTANQMLSESITISGLTGAKTVAYTYDVDGNRREWGLSTSLNTVAILPCWKKRLSAVADGTRANWVRNRFVRAR
jgi:YD repeat-containing protein